MEREQIATLMEKFWEGETTLEDERILKEYFAGPQVPVEWQDQALYFKYLETPIQNQAPADKDILSMLEDIKPEGASGGKKIKMWLENVVKIAAVIFIMGAAALFIRQDYMSKKDQIHPVLTDTFEDPQRAFEETKKALILVSRQFDKGKKHAQKLTVFDDAKEKVQQLERQL